MECYATHLWLWRAVRYSRKLWLPLPSNLFFLPVWTKWLLASTSEVRDGNKVIKKRERGGKMEPIIFYNILRPKFKVTNEWRIIFVNNKSNSTSFQVIPQFFMVINLFSALLPSECVIFILFWTRPSFLLGQLGTFALLKLPSLWFLNEKLFN